LTLVDVTAVRLVMLGAFTGKELTYVVVVVLTDDIPCPIEFQAETMA
jgi:hypothetical protein